ncbi:MAG: hypothetical protein H6701_03440 [Myxococcales bacterium]|nr:hypothetical protein [Myxococcales bacterium]
MTAARGASSRRAFIDARREERRRCVTPPPTLDRARPRSGGRRRDAHDRGALGRRARRPPTTGAAPSSRACWPWAVAAALVALLLWMGIDPPGPIPARRRAGARPA